METTFDPWVRGVSSVVRGAAGMVAVLAAGSGSAAIAADAESPWSLHGNVGLVSNYVSRGLTQTWGKPALQAEVEVEHDRGFYAGSFVSNVSRNQYPGGGVEFDLWAGYEHELGNDVTLAFEGYASLYPGANHDKGDCSPAPKCGSQSFNTLQGRVGAGWKWLSTKIGYSFTNYYGDSAQTGFQSNTRGTWYWQGNADYPLPADKTWHLVGHVGRTRYSAQYAYPSPSGSQNPDYWDWRVGATKSLVDSSGAFRIGAFYSQAGNRSFYDHTESLLNSGTRDLGRSAFIVEISRTF